MTLVIMLGLFLACIGLAVDTALVHFRVQELEVGSECAALGATRELFCNPGGSSPRQIKTASVFLRKRQRGNVRDTAVGICRQNWMGGHPIELDSNPSNHSAGNVVIGFYDFGTGVFRPSSGPTANAVRVQVVRSSAGGNPISLWFSRMLNVEGADRRVSSVAAVEQRVIGFRPLDDVSIPVLPFCFLGKLNDLNSKSGRFNIFVDSSFGRNDNENEESDDAEDGDDDDDDDARGPRSNRWRVLPCKSSHLSHVIKSGFSKAHLLQLGGAIRLGQSVKLDSDRLRVDAITRRYRELRALRGQTRILLSLQPNGSRQHRIHNFAAIRIIDCRKLGNDRIKLTAEWCRMTTATALVNKAAPANTWVGKLVLANEITS